jgi:hypothetical protein
MENDNITDDFEAFRRVWKEAMDSIENEQESFWNSLSKDDQLKAFCAVVRRIHKGELEKQGSYRYILYDVFGFDADSYAQAQCAGYIDLHNAIYTRDELKEFIERETNAKSNNV